MSQKLPVDGFKWDENTSQFNKNFREKYNEDSNEAYFLEVAVQYIKKPFDLYSNYLYIFNWKNENWKS